jgi:hypothetical protein
MIRWSIAALLLSIAAPAAASPERPLVLAFGDSLSAGYGLDPGLGFAPQLQAMLRRHGIAARVADGGVSGDTSAAARARLAEGAVQQAAPLRRRFAPTPPPGAEDLFPWLRSPAWPSGASNAGRRARSSP